ncbi:MAG: hypothetical protein H7281_12570 [Bacteriovorax sp.]|nr:hypothetical protein [Bacteriovorax sp.]
MKTTYLFISILALSLAVSCAQTATKKPAKIKNLGPLDMNATSAPMNGFNYYNLPPNAPVMEKPKSAKNTKPASSVSPVKKATVKKVK